MAYSTALWLLNRFNNSSCNLGYPILVPIATLLLMASSIFLTICYNSTGVSCVFIDNPDAAAFKVDMVNSLWASSTCCGYTVGFRCMRAIDSDNLIMASSCLTVIGIPVVFLEIRWSFEFYLSLTYMSWSMWPACSLRRGNTFILA